MGFGYAGTFLIIFLTHPGVIIPTTTSAASLLPAEAPAVVPPQGFPPILSGLWQTMWVWILTIAGDKSDGLASTLYTLYLVFLFIYMYLFLGSRIQKGI